MKRRGMVRCAVLLGVLVCVLPACPAGVPRVRLIFGQGDYQDSAVQSDLGGGAPGVYLQHADDFFLAPGLSAIKIIEWWGTQDAGITGADSFVIRIFEDNGSGAPNVYPLYSIPVGTGIREDTGSLAGAGSGGGPIYLYSAEVSPIALVPGQTYYLSIVNDIGGWAWMLADAETATPQCFYREAEGSDWTGADADLAFRLWQ